MRQRIPASLFMAVIGMVFQQGVPAATLTPSALAIEQSYSTFTDQVFAAYAYALGLSGKGVTIAMLDTGIAAAHSEFASPGKLLNGYNAAMNTLDVSDTSGHGTHVAGLLAAARDGSGMHGLAFDATLLPIKVFADNGAGNAAYVDRGLRYAIGKAAIANLSLSSTTASDPAAIRDAVRSGMLLVVAAGNNGGADPQWPARYAKEAWANNQLIAVGAVDEKNRIAAFSNRAGDTAAWYLVAPGVGLVSSAPGGAYASMSGTSMAAPVVSGAAALLQQMWPYLRADQVATILFVTATDLGAPGIDPVYGRGLLNVEKALQPVGVVKAVTWGGATIPLLVTSMSPSPATSKLWSLAASGALDAIGTDDFKRGYSLKMGSVIAHPPGMSLAQVFGEVERRSDIAEQLLDDGASLTVVSLKARGERSQLASFAYASAPGRAMSLAFGQGGMAGQVFGIAGTPLLQSLGAAPVLVNPYFSLLPGAAHMAISSHPDSATSLRLGWLSAGTGPTADDPVPRDSAMRARAQMALFEVLHGGDTGALSLSLSRTVEQDAFLAAQSQGSLAFGPQASTTAVQVGAAWRLAPRLVLAGQSSYGVTPGSVDRLSLISAMSPLRTNAFSLAVVAAEQLCPGDRLSFSLAQPLRAYAGTITLDTIAAIDDAGHEIRAQRTLTMVPSAREMLLELNYQRPMGRAARISLVLSLRRYPNHLDDTATEKLLAMRLVQLF